MVRLTLRVDRELINRERCSDGSIREESFFVCSTVEPNGIDIKMEIKIADKALREQFKQHYLKMEPDEKLGPTDFIIFELKYK